jgi:hypothetical protein
MSASLSAVAHITPQFFEGATLQLTIPEIIDLSSVVKTLGKKDLRVATSP